MEIKPIKPLKTVLVPSGEKYIGGEYYFLKSNITDNRSQCEPLYFCMERDNLREIIEKNRKRKRTKHKKLSNNTILEIDNCSPLEIQQLYEELEVCGERPMGYKGCFEIMGTDS